MKSPVTAFEHYMLADDNSTYPMQFFMKFHFHGLFDKDLFHAAAKKVMLRHPLTHSNLVGDMRNTSRSLIWKKVGAFEPAIIYNRTGPAEPIDLRTEVGIRFYFNCEEENTCLTVQAHHTTTDAKGVVQLVDEILTEYGDKNPPLRTELSSKVFSEAALRYRLDFGLSPYEYLRRLPRDLHFVFKFFSYLPHALVLPRTTDFRVSGQLAPSFSQSLSGEVFEKIKHTAKSAGVSINDLLLKDLFLTTHAWNQEHDPKRRRRVRIAVATNMRKSAQDDLPIANHVSMVFLDRGLHHCNNQSSLLSGINRQMKYVKMYRMGITLCRAIGWMGRLPVGISLMLKLKTCKPTIILSNLGEAFAYSMLPKNLGLLKSGNVALRGFELLPPVAPNTHFAFGVTTYNQELTISIHYNEQRIAAQTAKMFLSQYCKSIVASSLSSIPSHALSDTQKQRLPSWNYKSQTQI